MSTSPCRKRRRWLEKVFRVTLGTRAAPGMRGCWSRVNGDMEMTGV